MDNRQYMRYQKGFTLIELMVSIVLGLLVSAAALQLFTGGVISTRIQQASAELQDSGVFGMEYMARDIRLANHGNVNNPVLNEQTPWGGVILTARTATATVVNLPIPAATPFISSGLLSHSAGDTVSTAANEWKGSSAVNVSGSAAVSDQLTIQFIAPNDMINCEGQAVRSGDYVIQRYFLRPFSPTDSSLALACDANTPTAAPATPVAQPTTISGFGGAGEIIMPRVDHLRFYLGTRNATGGNMAYYSINQYRTLANTARTATPATVPPRIVSVKIEVLVRSQGNTQNKMINLLEPIQMLNEQVVPMDTTTPFARRAYSTTVAIRNAMGEPI